MTMEFAAGRDTAEKGAEHSRAELSPEERHRILVEWNDTECRVPPATLPEMFQARVDENPEAVALVFGDESACTELTYAEVDARANRLAHSLVARGVGPERVVGAALPGRRT